MARPVEKFASSGQDILRNLDDADQRTAMTPEEAEKFKAYFEPGALDDDDDHDDDPKNLDESKDADDEAVGFDGFASAPNESTTTPAATDPLMIEMQSMTAEKFQELIKNDPTKAMEMAVISVIEKRGLRGASVADVQQMTQQVVSQQDMRRIIAERFSPHKNTELRDRAKAIYDQRGFDVRKNPQAELDAFILASQESPTLVKHRSEDTENQITPRSRGRSRKMPDTRLTKDDLRIAQKMGIDLSDPKVARRIVEVKADYERRRRG